MSVDNDVTTAGLWCALRSFCSSFSCSSQLLSVWEHNCVNSVSVYSLVYQCISKEIVRWQRIVVYQGGMKGTAEKKTLWLYLWLYLWLFVFLITLLSAAMKTRPHLQLLAVSCKFQYHGVTLRSICNWMWVNLPIPCIYMQSVWDTCDITCDKLMNL